jgi:hypothetical protein
MKTDLVQNCTPPPGNQGVIGAGGINIFFHFGFFRAMRELGIDLMSMVTASAGTQAALFLANGYSIEETIEIFLRELKTARMDPTNWMRCFNPLADWLSISIGGWFSLKPYVAELMRKYKLKASNKLRILTCDYLTGEAVLFEGENYDLVAVVTASCSPKGWVQPVWFMHEGRLRLLVDGAHYHYNPTEFTCGTAIVSRFRSATEMPAEWQTWLDLYFQMRELVFPLAGNQRYVDEDHNVVVTNGRPNIGGLNLGISEETCRQMVEEGYNVAKPILERALAEGRITSNKPVIH